MKRWLRIITAVLCFFILTFYFLDFAGILSNTEAPSVDSVLSEESVSSEKPEAEGAKVVTNSESGAKLFPCGWDFFIRIQVIPAFMSHRWLVLGIIFAVTLLLGRLYCSVLCPLGIFQDVVSWCRRRFYKGKQNKKYEYHPEKRLWRYSILVLFVALGISGIHLAVSLLDPYSIYGRIAVNIFGPFYVMGNNILAILFSDKGYIFYEPLAIESLLALVSSIFFFVLIGVLAWRYGRLYCNTICPIGAILGLLSRFSFWKIRIDKSKCTHCGLCVAQCKSSCIDAKEQTVDNSRCVDCFNCLSACRRGALSWSLPLFSPTKDTEETKDSKPTSEPEQINSVNSVSRAEETNPTNRVLRTDRTKGLLINTKESFCKSEKRNNAALGKREFIATLATAAIVATVPEKLLQTAEKTKPNSSSANPEKMPTIAGSIPFTRKNPITPPGAENIERFSLHCTACHLCVNHCPVHVLKPAFLEYGLSGMLQPRVEFSRGFCNYDCTICSDICPNNALKKQTMKEKHLDQMGKVQLIKENCIVFTEGTSCGACSEHCPTQAVTMVEQKETGLPPIPVINPDICVGCGGCEFICPARPYRAIYIEGNPVHHKAKPIVESKKVDVQLDNFGF